MVVGASTCNGTSVGRVGRHGDVVSGAAATAYGDVLHVGLALRLGDNDFHRLPRSDSTHRHIDRTRSGHQSCAFQHIVLRNAHIRACLGINSKVARTRRNGRGVAHVVGRRIHAVRHDGAVAKHVVGLPVVKRSGAGLVVAGMGITHGEVAEEGDGRNGVIGFVHPNAVVNACSSVFKCGGLVHYRCGTHAEVIVFIPIGYGARADVAVGGLVFATEHGLAEAGLAVAEVTRQAAVAHSQEILVGVGQGVHVGNCELGVFPSGFSTVSCVVDKTDTRVQGVVAARILALVEVGVHGGEAVGRIIIIGGGVVDGGLADARVPITVPTGDEGHIAEVARVGHGVLLVLQNLVDDGRHLVGVFG